MASASAFEQNHLSPFKYQRPLSARALARLAPTSEPPCRSVRNIAPCQSCETSRVVRSRIVSATSGPEPCISSTRATPSVMQMGQKRPISVWAK